MYRDFGGVEFLEDEMYTILETMAPELEAMDEGDPRGSDERDPGDLQEGRFGPEELHVRAGGGVSVAEEKLAFLVRRTSSLCSEGWGREAGIETLFMGCDNSYQRG